MRGATLIEVLIFVGILGVGALFVGGIGLLIWSNIDEARHCTKWRTEQVKVMDCVWYSGKVCHRYEERIQERKICMERDDR